MAKSFVTIDEIESLPKNESILFADCRYSLSDFDYGKESYKEGHIPSAIFVDVENILSDEITNNTGRHPLPPIKEFYKWLKQNNFHPDMITIVYDDKGGGIAARLWWMLRQIGFRKVYILEGGIQAYAKSHQLSTESPPEHQSEFDLSINYWNEGPLPMIQIQELEKYIERGSPIIDSRSPERYTGKEEPIDPVPGRIPSSINYFWQMNQTESTQLREKHEILGNLQSVIDTNKLRDAAIYCGSGITACFNIAIIDELELELPALYAGSYSEWMKLRPNSIASDYTQPEQIND